jgi:hypothetical protein
MLNASITSHIVILFFASGKLKPNPVSEAEKAAQLQKVEEASQQHGYQ